MKLKRFSNSMWLLGFLCFFSMPSYARIAQSKGSIEKAIETGNNWLKKKNLDSARFYANLALQWAQSADNKLLQSRAALLKAQSSVKIEKRDALQSYLYARKLAIEAGENAVLFRSDLTIGSIYGHETHFDSNKYYYNEALEVAEKMVLLDRNVENLRRLGMINNNYGTLYMSLDQLNKAAYYLTETEKIGREINDTVMMFRSAVNVGAIYNELGSPENKVSSGFTQKMYLQKAVVFFKKAFHLLTPADEQYLPAVLNNLGISYLSMGSFDSAANYMERAMALYIKNDADKERICNCHLNLGSAYYKLDRFEASNDQFDQAVKLAETEDLKSCLISVLSNKGQLLTHWNRLAEAETVLQRALALKNSISGSNDNYLLYEKFYLLYEKKQDYRKAFEYYKLFVGARDSIADVDHLHVLDDIEIKYGTEKKDEQISELSLEKQLLIEKTRTREAQLRLRDFWIIGLVVFFLMAGAIIWFWIQRNKLKQQQAASDLEHRLLRARMNPHFLFNGLNTIQKHYAEGNSEEASRFMADFSKFLRLILNKTGETRHSLEDEIEFTDLYVSLEQRKYPDKIRYIKNIQPNLEIEQWMVPSLLFQPIVENAIWHGVLPTGKPGEISLTLKENAQHDLVCEITDNGVGYDKSIASKTGNHVSKAFELIEKRLGKNGKLEVETLNDAQKGTHGTRIIVTMNTKI